MLNCSVIIPNYNHGQFLKERIDSVLAQKKEPFEIIILDDHSTDNSRSIIETYRPHRLVTHIVYNEKNSGSPFRQWAKGIKLATSPWVWIAESDDVANPDFLEIAEQTIVKHPESGIFYSDSTCVATDTKKIRYNSYAETKNRFFKTSKWSLDYTAKGEDEINQSLKWICSINNSSATLFRKDKLIDILHVLETFIYHGDWYCQLAVATRSDVSYSAKTLNQFRMHEGSFLNQSNNKLQTRIECFRILQFLHEQDFVTSKNKLINFFALQYLGFGFLSDGYGFGKKLFRSYASINKPLAKLVWKSMLAQKITGKRRKRIF